MKFRLFIIAAILILPCGDIVAKGSGRSYSSGSRPTTSSASSSGKSFSSGVKPIASAPKPIAPTAMPKSYSSGTKTSYSKGPANFDKAAAKDQLKVESRQAYLRGNDPKPSFTTPSGKDVPIRSSDSTRIRSSMTQEHWVHRETRITTVYQNYIHVPQPTYVYNDHFNVFFWLWLMDRSADQRALWYYHHRTDVDAQRYKELVAKDAQLEARLKSLETQKVAQNTGYTPSGINGEDLMYTDKYVDAVVNPQPKAPANDGWGAMGWMCFGLVLLMLCVAIFYGVFVYEAF